MTGHYSGKLVFQNFSESYFLDDILSGKVTLPEGLAPEPFVDAEDIADIAAEALVGKNHSHKLYEVTGPEALTFNEAIKQIAMATQQVIPYQSVSKELYEQSLRSAGLPPEVVHLILYLFTTVLDGRNIPTQKGIEEALGRPPRSFSDYVAQTAVTGLWNRPRVN